MGAVDRILLWGGPKSNIPRVKLNTGARTASQQAILTPEASEQGTGHEVPPCLG